MQQGAYGQQGFQPPPPKKGMSGCLIAVLVVAGLVVVSVVVAGIGIWRVMESPEGQKIAKVIGEGSKIAEEARTAPGTAELRKAGCQEAMVLDPERMADLMRELGDAGAAKKDVEGAPRSIVCQVAALGKAPTCDSLAAVYVGAAHPGVPFHITVQSQGGSKPSCVARYSPEGTRLAQQSP